MGINDEIRRKTREASNWQDLQEEGEAATDMQWQPGSKSGNSSVSLSSGCYVPVSRSVLFYIYTHGECFKGSGVVWYRAGGVV